jgi:hypothetical protein
MFKPKGKKQQDTQCTYNVTWRRIRESLLQSKRNKYYIFVCACVCARVRVPGRVGVCTCVHVVLLIQHAIRMRHIVTSLVAP